MSYLRKVEILGRDKLMNLWSEWQQKFSTSNEKFTIKENSPKKSMFRRRP